MIFAFIEAEKASFPILFMCDRLGVSTSGFCDWRQAEADPPRRRREDAELVERIREIHTMSRRSYGSPRVHPELVLGEGRHVGRKRIARLMRTNGIVGIHRRRRGCTRRDPEATPADDLVDRNFDLGEPDRLWVSDVTEHPTAEGKVYLAVVLDAFSRVVLGWSHACRDSWSTPCRWPSGGDGRRRAKRCITRTTDPVRTRRGPSAGGCAAGLLGSMGSVGDCFDNAVAKSFFGTLQLELLDEHRWETRQQLGSAIFEWIEAWYNPSRRHSYCGMLSPADYEAAHRARDSEKAA